MGFPRRLSGGATRPLPAKAGVGEPDRPAEPADAIDAVLAAIAAIAASDRRDVRSGT